MLIIRFNRAGRTNSAFFRIVVTENSKPTKSGFIKVLGWYNPHTKEASIEKEEILKYLDNGAQVSNSMAKFLAGKDVKHKMIKFIPDAPGKKKTDEKPEAPAVKAESEEKKDESVDKAEDKTEEVETEVAAEETVETPEVEESPVEATETIAETENTDTEVKPEESK